MSNKVNVKQSLTNIVKIASIGPQGPAGAQGISGSQGIPGVSNIDTGSLGSTTITGSLTVSGSSTLTNIGSFFQTGVSTFDGNITLSGSLTVSGSGGVITSGDTGSFITNSQTSSMTVLSSSFATTASFISSTFISSSAAASGFGSGGGGSTIDTGSLGSTTITGSLTVSGSSTLTNIGPFSQTGNSTFDGNFSEPVLTISGSQDSLFGSNQITDKLRIGGNPGESFTFKYNTSTSGLSFASPILQISGSGGSGSFNPNIVLGSATSFGTLIGDNVIVPFSFYVGSRHTNPNNQSDIKNKYQFLISGSDGNAGGGVISLGKHGIDPSESSDIFLNGHIQAAGHITASGNISASSTSTASFGTYLGDGSQLTGISAGSSIDTGSLGSTTITGSLTVSGSNTFTNIGSFSQTGDATITGSLTISGSFNAFRVNSSNLVLGNGAGFSNTGPRNVFLGQNAGYTNTSGDENVCIGYAAGYALSTNASDFNVFIGKLAGAGGTSPAARMSDANYNIGIGQEALLYLTSGDSNIGFGFRTLRNISSGKYNLGFGDAALYNTDTGQNNIGLGHYAGLNQTSGNGNITIGSGSLGVAGESNQLRIGHANTIVISASLETGNIILQGDVSSSTASTSSFGTYLGDGSQLTGISAGSSIDTGSLGSTTITGSLTVSGSGGATIQSSGSTVFSVIGSEGNLFTVTDNLTTGSLFSVKDISGIPLLDVTTNSTIPDVVTIGQSNLVIDSGSLEVVGNTTLTGNISSSAVSTASFGTYIGDGSQLSGISAGSSINTGSLGSTTITGSLIVSGSGTLTNIGPFSQTGDSTFTGDITASSNISLPTNASSIRFNSAELHGRVGGSYPGLTINSGVSSGDRIWLRDAQGATGPVTMSFIGLGKIDGVQSIESQGNRGLKLRGGAGPNDANDGVQMFTGDASNVYQQRFAIEADGTNVDAYFTNINGLGINDDTPSATLDVNGNINTTSHITASGNISSSGNITALDLNLFGGDIDLKNAGAQSNIKFYCESANAHYTKLQAAPHSAYSGNPTVTLPAYAFDFAAPSFQSGITATGNVSSSAVSTASFGTYLGDGSQLTGISSGGGTSTMIASGSTSASADPGTGIVVNHSGSTAFSVIGDVGTLFSVDDSLTGTLFSANDISGFPVLQADSTGEVYLGKSPQSLYTTAVISSTTAATTHSLVSLSTSSYDGAFFEYTAISSSNARAGNIMSVWNGANIVSTETTSSQIGSTTDLTAEVIISQSQAQLVVYGANASYKVKTIIKAI